MLYMLFHDFPANKQLNISLHGSLLINIWFYSYLSMARQFLPNTIMVYGLKNKFLIFSYDLKPFKTTDE